MITQEQFDQLSDIEKKKKICQDVILKIENCYLIPEKGTVMKLTSSTGQILMQSNCHVCAMGSLFISACLIYDNIDETLGSLCKKHISPTNSSMMNVVPDILSFFSLKEWNMIETAFECYDLIAIQNYKSCNQYNLQDFKSALYFGKEFSHLRERLIAIMTNIIKYGEFRPDLGLRDLEEKEEKNSQIVEIKVEQNQLVGV